MLKIDKVSEGTYIIKIDILNKTEQVSCDSFEAVLSYLSKNNL